MPEIPVYYSRQKLQEVGIPRIPESAAGEVAGATAKLGERLAAVAEQEAVKQHDLKFSGELIDHISTATQELGTLERNTLASPEMQADPEGTAARYAEQTGVMQKAYLGKLTDPRMQLAFKKHFLSEFTASGDRVANAAIKQRYNLAGGSYQKGIITMGDAADRSISDEEFQRYVGIGQAIIAQKTRTGHKPEEVEREKRAWTSERLAIRAGAFILRDAKGAFDAISNGTGIYGGLDEKHRNELSKRAQSAIEHQENKLQVETAREETKMKQFRVNAAYEDVKRKLPGDPMAQLELLSDINIYPDLDQQQRESLRDSVRQDIAELEKRRTDNQKKIDDQVHGNFMSRMLAGRPPSDSEIDASDASPKTKEHMANAAKAWRDHEMSQADKAEKKKYATDPAVHADIISRIWTTDPVKRITDKTQLLPYVNKGLSVDDASQLEKSIERANDVTDSGYFKMASDMFKQKFPDKDDENRAMQAEFMILLDSEVKKEGLTGKAIFDRAKANLEVANKKAADDWVRRWIDPKATQPLYRKKLEEPFVEVPASVGLTEERKAQIGEVLRSSGKPVTDANILTIDRQLRAKGR